MQRFRFAMAIAATLLIASSAYAAEIDVPPLAKPKSPVATAPKNTSVHVNQPNCVRWTDECVNCTRGIDGAAPTCSNIGFACQPKDIHCIGLDDTPGQTEKK